MHPIRFAICLFTAGLLWCTDAQAAGLERPRTSPPPPAGQSDPGVAPWPADLQAKSAACPADETPVLIRRTFEGRRGIDLRLNGVWQRLILPPGEYGIKRRREAWRVDVEPEQRTRIDSLCLDLVGRLTPNFKDLLPPVVRTDLPAGSVILGVAGGRRFGEAGGLGRFSLAGWTVESTQLVFLTEHLIWPVLPALAYRFDQGNHIEWIPWIGMYNWGFSIPDQREPIPFLDPGTTDLTIPDFRLTGFIGAGLDLRIWLNSFISAIVSSGSISVVQMSVSEEHRRIPDSWRQVLTLGLSATLPPGWLTVNLAVGVGANWLFEGQIPTVAARGHRFGLEVNFGSFHYFALRHLPLLQFHLNDHLHVEVYASGSYNVRRASFEEVFLLGLGGVL